MPFEIDLKDVTILVLALAVAGLVAYINLTRIINFVEDALEELSTTIPVQWLAAASKSGYRYWKGLKLRRETNKAIRRFRAENANSPIDLVQSIEVCQTKDDSLRVLKRGGKLQIFQDSTEHSQENLHKVLVEVARSAIPNKSSILARDQQQAIAFRLAEALIQTSSSGSLRTFLDTHRLEYDSLRSTSEYQSIETIDGKGFFSRVLVPSLSDYGTAFNPRKTSSELQEASREYISNLEKLSSAFLETPILRDNGENGAPLMFVSDCGVSSNVMLIGRHEHLRAQDEVPYKRKLNELLSEGVRNLYVVSYVPPDWSKESSYWSLAYKLTDRVIRGFKGNKQLEFLHESDFPISIAGELVEIKLAHFRAKSLPTALRIASA